MSAFANLAGMLPASMLDWPGELCAVLFLKGCNFRCPYCHNPELVQVERTEEGLDWSEISTYLSERRGWLDGVSITGGEPTLHADLADLCAAIKEAGLKVKLDTNGSRPRFLRELLEEGTIDFLAMDVKSSPGSYHRAAGRPVDTAKIKESIETVITSGLEHEFRCTVVPGLVGLEDLEVIAGMLKGARRLVLQQFRSEKTLDPAYADVEAYGDETLLEWSERLTGIVPTVVRGLVGVG